MGTLGEFRPPPRRICSGSEVRIRIPYPEDYFQNLSGTSCAAGISAPGFRFINCSGSESASGSDSCTPLILQLGQPRTPPGS